MKDGGGMNGIQILPKEKELGLKFKCFEGRSFDEALKIKNKWFARNKGLKVVKLKTRVNHGRGRVVGKWSNYKIYVSYIEVDKFEELKDYRRKRHEKTFVETKKD